jgi:hypothetical protein
MATLCDRDTVNTPHNDSDTSNTPATPGVQQFKWTLSRVSDDATLCESENWSFLYNECIRKGADALDAFKKKRDAISGDVHMVLESRRHFIHTPEDLRLMAYVYLLKNELGKISSIEVADQSDHTSTSYRSCLPSVASIENHNPRYFIAKKRVRDGDLVLLLNDTYKCLKLPESSIFNNPETWCPISDDDVYTCNLNDTNVYNELFDNIWVGEL